MNEWLRGEKIDCVWCAEAYNKCIISLAGNGVNIVLRRSKVELLIPWVNLTFSGVKIFILSGKMQSVSVNFVIFLILTLVVKLDHIM